MKKYLSILLSVLSFACLCQMIFPSVTVCAAEQEQPYVSYNFKENLNDSKNHSTLTVLDSATDPGTTKSSFGKDDIGSYWEWSSEKPHGGGFISTLIKI